MAYIWKVEWSKYRGACNPDDVSINAPKRTTLFITSSKDLAEIEGYPEGHNIKIHYAEYLGKAKDLRNGRPNTKV